MERVSGKFIPFYDVWSAFREPGQVVPLWQNVRPMMFGDLLAHVTMVKKYGPRDYRYRLLGSEVNLKMGDDPVGEDFFKYLPTHLHDYAYKWLDKIVAQPCAAWHEMSLEFANNKSRRYESLNLPIMGSDGQIDTFLYYNKGWQPQPGENLGPLLSSGAEFFTIEPVDVGAGIPDTAPPLKAAKL